MEIEDKKFFFEVKGETGEADEHLVPTLPLQSAHSELPQPVIKEINRNALDMGYAINQCAGSKTGSRKRPPYKDWAKYILGKSSRHRVKTL
jgi:transcription initiation factor TFIID subunit TAF12